MGTIDGVTLDESGHDTSSLDTKRGNVKKEISEVLQERMAVRLWAPWATVSTGLMTPCWVLLAVEEFEKKN